MNAQRGFLRLGLRLAGVPLERVEALVREAWVAQVPKTLVKHYMG